MRIGIDLGGTKIEGLALEDGGRELTRLRVPTPRDDYEATLAAIAGLVHALEAEHRAALAGRTATVGVGIPGTIVRATGLVKNANSTWLNGHPLEHDLARTLGREVRCANDANCFTLSEATDGAAAGHRLVFGVILGTGCGGGIAVAMDEAADTGAPVRLQVHAGRNGLGGEWGHTPLPWATADELPGPACYCGHSGCLEQWISGTGFEAEFQRVTGRRLRAAAIAAAAAEGDAEAGAALERLLDRIARGLAVVVDILDPDAFVLGGGLSNLDILYSGGLAARLGGYCFGGGAETPILRHMHGDSSGVRGAAWLWPRS